MRNAARFVICGGLAHVAPPRTAWCDLVPARRIDSWRVGAPSWLAIAPAGKLNPLDAVVANRRGDSPEQLARLGLVLDVGRLRHLRPRLRPPKIAEVPVSSALMCVEIRGKRTHDTGEPRQGPQAPPVCRTCRRA